MMGISSSFLLALQMICLQTDFSSPLLRALFPGHLSDSHNLTSQLPPLLVGLALS